MFNGLFYIAPFFLYRSDKFYMVNRNRSIDLNLPRNKLAQIDVISTIRKKVDRDVNSFY